MADNLTRRQRSYMMSRVRSTDTTPELMIRKLAHARGLRFRKHHARLPGRPDLVFVTSRVAVFVDGDYWHGWRFSTWMSKLSVYWQEKIAKNRVRDQRNSRRLRRAGWTVIRVWEHDIESNVHACIDRIERAVRARASGRLNRPGGAAAPTSAARLR
jgi:DNA mismatch endonuclease, patch repair protein